jgi:hypothetical protein
MLGRMGGRIRGLVDFGQALKGSMTMKLRRVPLRRRVGLAGLGAVVCVATMGMVLLVAGGDGGGPPESAEAAELPADGDGRPASTTDRSDDPTGDTGGTSTTGAGAAAGGTAGPGPGGSAGSDAGDGTSSSSSAHDPWDEGSGSATTTGPPPPSSAAPTTTTSTTTTAPPSGLGGLLGDLLDVLDLG